jgi:hypothetical protein
MVAWIALALLVGDAGHGAELRRVIRLHNYPGIQVRGLYTFLPDPQTGRLFVAARGSSNLCAVGPGPDDVSRPVPLRHDSDYRQRPAMRLRPVLTWGRGRELLVGMHHGLWRVDADRLAVLAHRSWPDREVGSVARGPDSLCAFLPSKGWGGDDCVFAILEPDTLKRKVAGKLPWLLEEGSLDADAQVRWSEDAGTFVAYNVENDCPPTWNELPGGFQGLPISLDTGLPEGLKPGDKGVPVSPPSLPPGELVFRATNDDGGTWRLTWSSWKAPDEPLGEAVIGAPGESGDRDESWKDVWPDEFYTGVLAAISDPQKRRCVVVFSSGYAFGAVVMVDMVEKRRLGLQVLEKRNWDPFVSVPEFALAADWPNERIYVSLPFHDGIQVLSARDLEPLTRYVLGGYVRSVDFDPWHSLLSIVGGSNGNVAWVIDGRLGLRKYGPEAGAEWLSIDPHRRWVYTNRPSIDGSSGAYIHDLVTGQPVGEVLEQYGDVFSDEDMATHLSLSWMTPDIGRDLMWRVRRDGAALEAFDHETGDLTQTLSLRPPIELPRHFGAGLLLDPRRRVGFITIDGDRDAEELYRVTLETGETSPPYSLGNGYASLAVCPWTGHLAAVDAQGDLVLLDDKGRKTESVRLPSGEELAGVGPEGLWPEARRRPRADFRYDRLLVVDTRAAVVMAVEE